jgi:hypothetical protein
MKYELWQLTRIGEGEPFYPMTLIDKRQTFEEIYSQFQSHVKKVPCAIILNFKSQEESGK